MPCNIPFLGNSTHIAGLVNIVPVKVFLGNKQRDRRTLRLVVLL